MSVVEFRPRNSCPMCSSSDLEERLVLDGIRIASCVACGFTFARDMLPPTAIDRFYIDGYQDRRHMDGQRVNARVNADLLRRFCPELAGKSILDIGSGYGFLLDALRGSGAARLVGVELSRAQRAYAKSELRLETYGQLGELGAGDQFDLVTAFEVIEHIPTPREFFIEACKYLKPGGSLIIGTDNFASDVVRVLGAHFPKWIPHEHVSFFSSASLQRLFTTSGELTVSGTRSFTPWELLLRKAIFGATGGRKGGKTYSYRAETASATTRGYRYFALRLAANHLWFKVAGRPNLDGEMMFIQGTKRSLESEVG